MSQIFVLAAAFVFLTILAESISLILQLRGKYLTKWFGGRAFLVHALITGAFWTITMLLVLVLQFEPHPRFHDIVELSYFGLYLLVVGLFLATWAFKLLGIKRSLCINFFQDKVPIVRSSLYRFFEDPMDNGFWLALIGFSLFTGSVYNLLITLEFIVIMIPHMALENVRIRK